MTQIHSFVFNAFSENTYLLAEDDGTCLIIDPGMNDGNERKKLEVFIKNHGLLPTHIINTHCHVDHVLGNKWCKDKYGIPLWIPKGEEIVLARLLSVAQMYGVHAEPSPEPDFLMQEGQEIICGPSRWQLISAPGHSPASICMYESGQKILIAGDVIFYESIGRTDLPGGNHQLLLQNIRDKILNLPDEVKVYPGHGPPTSIGHERVYNPFLN
jgi:glyoxylase-like metal-dependent hydrolase (beta-lactamase superfamily II)